VKTALLLAVASALSIACGGEDDESLPEVDCSQPVPAYGAVTAFAKCGTCHASSLSGTDRRSAPDSVNFDSYGAASSAGDEAVEEVQKGDMPPPGSGVSLSEEEKQELYRWALCGTPM
jgi:uncharacterized membrane protein